MFEITKNPPLTSYFIASCLWLFEDNEYALHFLFALWAFGLMAGIYCIAKTFSPSPFIATWIACISPVFAISSLTVMSDIMMMFWWVWALWFWMKGLSNGRQSFLLLASLCVCACGLTKYFGMFLAPLLCLYAALKRHPPVKWGIFIVLPIVFFIGYDGYTSVLYGHGLISDAFSYSQSIGPISGKSPLLINFMIGLSFLGGCMISLIMLFPLLFKKHELFILIGLLLLFAGCLFGLQAHQNLSGFLNGPIRQDTIFHVSVFCIVGAALLWFCCMDVAGRQDHVSIFLCIWVLGTFVFASFLNWTMSARALLPLAPAMGILVSRRMKTGAVKKPALVIFATFSILISYVLVCADYSLANISRKAAQDIMTRYSAKNRTVWFQGHWGWQYYMEKYGAKALDLHESNVKPGDLIVFASSNTNVEFFPTTVVTYFPTLSIEPFPLASLMTGAGFYSSVWGPIPFAFGPTPPVSFDIAIVSGK
jgi:4-amino-4-deoxy-L-arabinose transferase-like glycosyltransferase